MEEDKNESKPDVQHKAVPDLSYSDAVNLKKELTTEIKSSVKDDIRKWILHWGWVPVAVVIAILTFFGWWSYQGLMELQQRILARATEDFDRTVRERFSEANVGATVDALIQEQAADLIKSSVEEYAAPRIQAEVSSFRTESIFPLTYALEELKTQSSNIAERVVGLAESLALARNSTASLQEVVDAIKNDIEKEQAILAREQQELADKLRIQELSISAKSGSRAAYDELFEAMRSPERCNDLLRAVMREIELFYDADRNQLSFMTLVEASTMKDPGFSADEVVFILRTQPSLAEAAVNTLSRLKAKATVGELCRLALDGLDLRVAARATRALNEITGEKFRPLEFDKVRIWWDAKHTNEVYRGEYDNYVNTVQAMQTGQIQSIFDVERHLSFMRKTTESDPEAFHARCMMAGLYLISGRSDQAKELLDEVRTKRPDYAWLHLWDTAWHIINDQLDEAATALNKAFVKYPGPTIEAYIRNYNIFQPLHDVEDINWPSRNH